MRLLPFAHAECAFRRRVLSASESGRGQAVSCRWPIVSDPTTAPRSKAFVLASVFSKTMFGFSDRCSSRSVETPHLPLAFSHARIVAISFS